MTGVLSRAREELERLRRDFPDPRLEAVELDVRPAGGGLRLTGSTTVPGLAERVARALEAVAGEGRLQEEVRRLGAAAGGGGRALVRAGWTPARREPGHRAELVSQWLCGEVLELLEERDGWARCRDEGGYLAWTPASALVAVTPEEAERWMAEACLRSWGTALLPGAPGEAVTARETVPSHLPRGARVRPGPEGVVLLPGGLPARPAETGAFLSMGEGALPAAGAAVARTAERWLGTPYLWGGRTEWGVDCSGLVQAAYAFHGIALPRDSDLQLRAGPGVALPSDPGREPVDAISRADLRPGDLLFFAPEGRGVTHVALAAGGSRILHAAASNGWVAVDDLLGERELEARLRGSLVARTRPLEASGR